jgi:hypothetical protein
MERHRSKEHQPVSLAEAAKTYAEQGWPVFPLAGKYSYKGTHGQLSEMPLAHPVWACR